MKRGSHRFAMLGLTTLLGLLIGGVSAPVLAQKGGSGGGGGGAIGGAAGNNNKSGLSTSNLTFDNWGIYYNRFLPLGQVTFSYSADGTTKSMNVQLSNINAPDGTVMTVETVEEWITPTGNKALFSYYPITIRQGKGTLSVSTANGDSVMFLTPLAGGTTVYIFAANHVLMGAQLGEFGG